MPPVDAVHDLQRAVGVRLGDPFTQELPEAGRFLGESHADEAVEREGGVPHPGVAVVPVAHAADRLREAGRGCGHDRARRLEGHELQREHRAVDGLAPAPGVGALIQPAPPPVRCVVEDLELLFPGECQTAALAALDLPQHEDRCLPVLEAELGRYARAVALQPDIRHQAQAQARRVEAGALR